MKGRWYPQPGQISEFTPAEFEAYCDWIGLTRAVQESIDELKRLGLR
jgi:hypothetical protein